MTAVLAVLADPILPVFAILAFGFAMGRTGNADVADARVINRFAMSVLLPIMIFGLIASAPIHSFSLLPVALYLACEATLFALGFWLARRVFGRDPAEAVLLGFCGIFANNAFYVLPISILLYGPGNVLPVTSIVTLDAIVAFAGAMLALQVIALGQATPLGIARVIARTPLFYAVLAGTAVALAGVAIPDPVQTFIDFNGVAAAPVALFALGVVLAETRFRADPAVATFVGVKLFVFPAAVWAVMAVAAADDPGRPLFVLGAAGPSGAMAFSMALLHGVRTDTIAPIIVWTSVFSLVSLAVLA